MKGEMIELDETWNQLEKDELEEVNRPSPSLLRINHRQQIHCPKNMETVKYETKSVKTSMFNTTFHKTCPII